jgi:hypothetical protein
MELTWAPAKEFIARCALALCNLGTGVRSRLFDVIRAKSYPVDRKSRHILQMVPRTCSHQPRFRSSWKHSALVETDPWLPWVLRNLWNRGCGASTLEYYCQVVVFWVSNQGSRVLPRNHAQLNLGDFPVIYFGYACHFPARSFGYNRHFARWESTSLGNLPKHASP